MSEKFFIETFGCKFNKADSELIRKILIEKGFKEASEKEADFVVLNTCGVVEKTERKIIKRTIELKKKRKKVIFAGCLPLISPEICQKVADGLIGPTNILDLPKIVKKVLKGGNAKRSEKDAKRPEKVKSLKQKPIDKAKLRCFAIPKESVVAIIPISEGCLSFCSYCATRLAKGKLRSFNKEEILENIKLALKTGAKTLSVLGAALSGAKEIQLTSQDLAIYGLDKGKFLLPELLKEISKIEGDFRVRLGMMNPKFAKRIFGKILKILETEKFYKFLHLPLESGSNDVLKAMNRNYKVEEFLEMVSNFKRKFKNSLLATDIIVGFPTETEKDFEETVSVIKKIKPEILHIFKYSKRERTKAAKFKDFPDRIKKERSRILTKIWQEISKEKSKKYLGKKFEALITEKRGDTFLARLPSYKAVILKEGNLGEFVKVKIVGAKPNYLIGKICKG
jgi:threonylcarbamoyladenosine tRNA methylthiotransferase CDKAL1